MQLTLQTVPAHKDPSSCNRCRQGLCTQRAAGMQPASCQLTLAQVLLLLLYPMHAGGKIYYKAAPQAGQAEQAGACNWANNSLNTNVNIVSCGPVP